MSLDKLNESALEDYMGIDENSFLGIGKEAQKRKTIRTQSRADARILKAESGEASKLKQLASKILPTGKQEESAPEVEPKKSNTGLIVGIVVAVIVVGLVLFFVSKKKK
jgi:hypothetical protein